MKLKYIKFVLENCDCVTVDGKYIGAFIVGDIKTDIHRIACNSIRRMDSANEIVIEIHKNANKEHLEHGQKDWETSVFTALTRYNDITSIEFELEDQYVGDGEIPRVEHYDYYVSWTGDSDYENDSQKSYISKPGHLYLVINKDKDIEDYFDKEEIDDEDMSDFYFDMCDIGDDDEDAKAEVGLVLEAARKYVEDKDFENATKCLDTVLNIQNDKIDGLIASVDEAIEPKDICNLFELEDYSTELTTCEAKYVANGIKCPHCGESYYQELCSSSTAIYYPPIYKDGVNINPDRNRITTKCKCMNCGKEFTYKF